ncbi:hypothetical protein RhiirC2_96359 [Rhizophagus irregularis]|uniref:Uncharacterized protein n=1 Tax=Rhizophagus irregularis TaxID=588596 RepID=A0A2N1MSK5_9GLOM|nr:hypothetical protein RhiirC2_96359 [Rhizophagus irregularis]
MLRRQTRFDRRMKRIYTSFNTISGLVSLHIYTPVSFIFQNLFELYYRFVNLQHGILSYAKKF